MLPGFVDMSEPYEVEAGEHLASIAARNGVVDPIALHDAPENAEFKKLRPDPGVLAPGDELFLPEVETKSVQCKPGSDNVFIYDVPSISVRLQFVDEEGEPRPGLHALFRLGEIPETTETDDNGMLELDLPATFEDFECKFDGGKLRLRIGDLDPVSTSRGRLTRLQNLGYLPAPLPEDTETLAYAVRLAVEEFMVDYGLTPKPKLDDAGCERLLEVHGS